jgi:3-hydroxyisobutyrate dehydrogenase
MGQPMALHLAGEHALTVHNRTPARAEPLLRQGANWADSPRGAAEASDIVFLMLKNDDAVQAVCGGAEGLLAGVHPGMTIVDHSTISPALTRSLAAQSAGLGAEWIDAPVTGGDAGAKAGTLTIMAGATEEGFARVVPYLKLEGRRIVRVGPAGQGQTLKLVANLVSALNLMAASEGLKLGLALGLEVDVMETVMQNGSAQSFELAKVVDRLRSGNYEPGFSVDNRYKDLRLAVDLAEHTGFSADLGGVAQELFRRHLQSGYSEQDETSYIKRWTESE